MPGGTASSAFNHRTRFCEDPEAFLVPEAGSKQGSQVQQRQYRSHPTTGQSQSSGEGEAHAVTNGGRSLTHQYCTKRVWGVNS
jgi:hypothetical protein